MRRTTQPLVPTAPLTAGHVPSMRAGAWVSFQNLCEHRYKKTQGSVIHEYTKPCPGMSTTGACFSATRRAALWAAITRPGFQKGLQA